MICRGMSHWQIRWVEFHQAIAAAFIDCIKLTLRWTFGDAFCHFALLRTKADIDLFTKVLNSPDHVLHPLLPHCKKFFGLKHQKWGCISCIHLWWLETPESNGDSKHHSSSVLNHQLQWFRSPMLWWLKPPLIVLRNTISGGFNHHNIGDLNHRNWWFKTLFGWCFESPFDSEVSNHHKWMQLMHPHIWWFSSVQQNTIIQVSNHHKQFINCPRVDFPDQSFEPSSSRYGPPVCREIVTRPSLVNFTWKLLRVGSSFTQTSRILDPPTKHERLTRPVDNSALTYRSLQLEDY